MPRRKTLSAASALALALVAGLIIAQEKKPEPPRSARPADEAAIRRTMNNFVAAFEKGDANAAAALLTSEAELIADDAPTVRGRDAIQKALAAHFAKNPKVKIALEVESQRFLSRDTAIEEGHIKTTRPKETPTHQRYSVLYVREDGKWLLSVIKEWPSEQESMRDLEWLIGTWTAKRADVEVESTYEWIGNKSFIKAKYNIRGKANKFSGMQIIGLDPNTGDLRTWMFEADGGFGEGTIERDGKTWVFESTTTMANGSEMTAQNILLPLDGDTFTWQPVNIAIDGEPIADMPPVKVKRVKK